MASIRELRPWLQPYAEWLVDWARNQGATVTITSVHRSTSRQRKLYAEYVAGRTKYPVAKPGSSTHEHDVAFDLIVTPEPFYRLMGEMWEKMGGTWGGRFRHSDPIHFDARRFL